MLDLLLGIAGGSFSSPGTDAARKAGRGGPGMGPGTSFEPPSARDFLTGGRQLRQVRAASTQRRPRRGRSRLNAPRGTFSGPGDPQK